MFASELPEVQPEPAEAFVDWDSAGCRDGTGKLTALFFSEEIPDILRAKHICAACPVAAPCLAGALDRREPWGVWGGELLLNGRVLAQKRRRGRPRKQPVAGDMLVVLS